MKVTVELGGGLDALTANQKTHRIELDERDQVPISTVLEYVRDHIIKERKELFIQDGTVRPGILVLINDVDWELDAGLKSMVKNGDNIVFISTLHGG